MKFKELPDIYFFFWDKAVCFLNWKFIWYIFKFFSTWYTKSMDIFHSLTSPTKIKSILFAKDYASNFSCCLVTQSYSNQLFVIPWTAVPPHPGLLCPWDFPGKNTAVDCHFLLQGIFPTQGSSPHLLSWQADSLP